MKRVLVQDDAAVEPDPSQVFEVIPNEVEWPEAVDANFASSLANAVQVSVHWGADGSINIAAGPNSIGFTAAGVMSISRGNSTITIAADDTIGLVTNVGAGIHITPTGVITVGETVTVNPDSSIELAGLLTINPGGSNNIVTPFLPTSDPAVAGALWADSLVVKVSAG